MTARVSMLLKSRASPYMLAFSLCNKKRLAIRHMNGPPLSNDTIDSVVRHGEVVGLRAYQHPLVNQIVVKLVLGYYKRNRHFQCCSYTIDINTIV